MWLLRSRPNLVDSGWLDRSLHWLIKLQLVLSFMGNLRLVYLATTIPVTYQK
jgi:hypothetical protein